MLRVVLWLIVSLLVVILWFVGEIIVLLLRCKVGINIDANVHIARCLLCMIHVSIVDVRVIINSHIMISSHVWSFHISSVWLWNRHLSWLLFFYFIWIVVLLLVWVFAYFALRTIFGVLFSTLTITTFIALILICGELWILLNKSIVYLNAKLVRVP
jgi:hypothetical protein